MPPDTDNYICVLDLSTGQKAGVLEITATEIRYDLLDGVTEERLNPSATSVATRESTGLPPNNTAILAEIGASLPVEPEPEE